MQEANPIEIGRGLQHAARLAKDFCKRDTEGLDETPVEYLIQILTMLADSYPEISPGDDRGLGARRAADFVTRASRQEGITAKRLSEMLQQMTDEHVARLSVLDGKKKPKDEK